MVFKETILKGAYIIDVEPFQDDRGFFCRTFCQEEFKDVGLKCEFVQINHSGSFGRGIIRGMHYQLPPAAEVKVLKCIKGKVFDVIIDIRQHSPTFLQWIGVELSANNKRMLYVPEGFAHGFQSLEEETELIYLVSAFYNPKSERGIRYCDPKVGIDWPLPLAKISEKDTKIPLLKEEFLGVVV